VLSSNAKNLICGLMHKDVTMRLTVQQAIDHPWFKNSENVAITDNEDDSSSSSNASGL